MASLAVNEIRALISQYLQSCKTGATAPEIVDAFRKKHAASISKASFELENIGLTKLINEVGSRVPSPALGQQDLFSGYSVPDAIVIKDADYAKRKVHKPIEEVTIREAEIWIDSHSKPKLDLSAKVIEMRRLLDSIKPFAINDEVTIQDALRLSRENKQPKVA